MFNVLSTRSSCPFLWNYKPVLVHELTEFSDRSGFDQFLWMFLLLEIPKLLEYSGLGLRCQTGRNYFPLSVGLFLMQPSNVFGIHCSVHPPGFTLSQLLVCVILFQVQDFACVFVESIQVAVSLVSIPLMSLWIAALPLSLLHLLLSTGFLIVHSASLCRLLIMIFSLVLTSKGIIGHNPLSIAVQLILEDYPFSKTLEDNRD